MRFRGSKNSFLDPNDVVEMAAYAPLFSNINDQRWKPDAIFFNSWQAYGIPSYWMQTFFTDSSGATLLSANFEPPYQSPLVASAINYLNPVDNNYYMKIKVVNFQDKPCNLNISIEGVAPNAIKGAKEIVLTGSRMDQNSFANPKKVAPQSKPFIGNGNNLNVMLQPY
ncbi:aspartate-semialdehyde dehydrogenase-like protein [Ancistrocladus abbreviatus]